MEMMQYRPWEKNEVNKIIQSVSQGQLPILDIQLGGGCSCNCMYCDTPRYDEPCLVNLDAIYKIICQQSIMGVYVCGLGEPTYCQNIRHLKAILAMCKERGIWLSMFTNLITLDDELLEYIDNGTLNLLFKFDTENSGIARRLYGQLNLEKVRANLNNMGQLQKVTHVKDGVTNIGASIVPNRLNYSELKKIIKCCLDNEWFPLMGQLERAGMCAKVFDELRLTDEELNGIKQVILETWGIDYEIPTCSATISGIHITNRNKVILDKRTGLSCPWFWLDEPQIEVIGDNDSE